MDEDVNEVITRVGPRLRALRHRHDMTLAELADVTRLSISLLSRLESGKRRPTLEVLIPLAQAFRTTLDDLVGAPRTGDHRLHLRPANYRGLSIVPLTRYPGPLQAYKQVLAGRDPEADLPDPVVHPGHEWFCVLSGRLRLVLGDRDVVLTAGQAAEFDTRTPHWFGSADTGPVELLNLFGPDGRGAPLVTADAPGASVDVETDR